MSKEFYKTLIFIDERKEYFGKYAHPIQIGVKQYEWGGSDMPLLMTMKTTIRNLKQLYSNLDFFNVRLVIKKLIDIETDNS